MQVATGTASTLLGGVTIVTNSQFTVAIDPDTINEEIVFITAGPSGDTFTITRGRAGSTAVAHSTGATIKHVLTSDDLTAFAAGISPVSSLGFSGSTSGTTTVQATAIAGTNTLTLPATTSDTLAGIAATQTLTNKTISASSNTLTGVATLTGTEVLSNKILLGPEERTTVSATAATGTVNFDTLTQGVLYYTSNASANWTLNVRGSSSATLNSILTTGDSITVAFLVTQGATAYYQTAFNIDGSVVTPKYTGGTAPSAGNASSVDIYTYTIIKTAATPTYTVFGAGPIKYA
jgi:hypothetical protein